MEYVFISALVFLGWCLTKSGKSKVGGEKEPGSKHYLYNFPGKNATCKEIIEAHLDTDLKNCEYYEDPGCNKHYFLNRNNQREVIVEPESKSKKIKSIYDKSQFGTIEVEGVNGEFKKQIQKEYNPTTDEEYYLRELVKNSSEFKFNKRYKKIKDD